jgi:ribosomal protein S21
MEGDQIDLAIQQFQKAREGQELFIKIRDPLYFEAQAQEKKGDRESLQKSLEIYEEIYETDINFRDVKNKMPELQKRLKEMHESPGSTSAMSAMENAMENAMAEFKKHN